jgi:hypothetical protein
MIRATFVLIFFLSSGLIFADYRAGDKGRPMARYSIVTTVAPLKFVNLSKMTL